MERRVGKLRYAVLVLAFALVVTACSMVPASSTGPRAGSDIVIGVPFEATGAYTNEGGQSRQGYDLWANWANSQGGIVIKGVRHHVRLLYQDDQSLPQVVAQVTEQMITQSHVQFLLSPYGTPLTLAASPVADKFQVPMVNSNGAAPQTAQVFQNSFGVMAPADQYPKAVIDWEITQNPRPMTVGIIAANDPASMLIAQATAQYSALRGIKVVYFQQYPAGTTNLYPLVNAAQDKHPDIFFDSGHFLDSVAAEKAVKDLDFDARLYTFGVGPTQPEFAQALGPVADYVVTAAPWTAQALFHADHGPSVAEFVNSYRQKYHTQRAPDFVTADSMASGLALQFAIEHAGSMDRDKVRSALASLDVNTFYGRIKFDPQSHQNSSHSALVVQVQHGVPQTVWPAELASSQPTYPTPTWLQRLGAAAVQAGLQAAKPKLPGTGVP